MMMLMAATATTRLLANYNLCYFFFSIFCFVFTVVFYLLFVHFILLLLLFLYGE